MSQDELCLRLLEVIEREIIPLTRLQVNNGNKVFGAAILNKLDLSLIVAGTNKELKNPIFHGEISTILNFFEIPKEDRPEVQDCIFLSTHEPCSLCLSAITWAGFNNFYYFFGYEVTRDAFLIPHDLRILKEIFNVSDGKYNNNNTFWKGYSITEILSKNTVPQSKQLISRIRQAYQDLSETYQNNKENDQIPFA